MNDIMILLGNAVDGRDDEFNAWYDDQHLPEVLALDGFAAAQRFRLVDGTAGDPPYRYLTVYELNDGAVDTVRAALAAARHDQSLTPSDAMDNSRRATFFFTAISDRVEAADRV